MNCGTLPSRLAGEPERWYARFCDFCLTGPERTLEGVWRVAAKGAKGQRVPGSWSRASERWKWRSRAADFDCLQFQRQAAEVENMRREERARRRSIVSKLGARVDALLLEQNAPADVTPTGLAALARVYLAASCIEFGPPMTDVVHGDDDHVGTPLNPVEPPKMIIEIVDHTKRGQVVRPGSATAMPPAAAQTLPDPSLPPPTVKTAASAAKPAGQSNAAFVFRYS